MASQTETDLRLKLKQLEAELAAEKAKNDKPLSIKVSDKGVVSVYGLGRFPFSLYASQWSRLADFIQIIMEFCKTHGKTLDAISIAHKEGDKIAVLEALEAIPAANRKTAKDV